MEAHLRANAQVHSNRADDLLRVLAEQRAALSARWAQDWKLLVDPKAVLAQTFNKLGVFKSAADFQRALFARCREDAQLRPQSYEDFRLSVAASLIGGAPKARP
jgi:hypothetical protein